MQHPRIFGRGHIGRGHIGRGRTNIAPNFACLNRFLVGFSVCDEGNEVVLTELYVVDAACDGARPEVHGRRVHHDPVAHAGLDQQPAFPREGQVRAGLCT
jgi:hypothetical protein